MSEKEVSIQVIRQAEQLAVQALDVLELIDGVALSSNEELAQCELILKLVKGRQKFIKEEKTISTKLLADAKKELDAQKKEIEAHFSPAEDRYAKMEIQLKKLVINFKLLQEEKKAALELQARAATTIDQKMEILDQRSEVQEATHIKGVSTSEIWLWEITNADKVPRELCSPDPKLVDLAIASGQRDIPGLTITKSFRVRAGSK